MMILKLTVVFLGFAVALAVVGRERNPVTVAVYLVVLVVLAMLIFAEAAR